MDCKNYEIHSRLVIMSVSFPVWPITKSFMATPLLYKQKSRVPERVIIANDLIPFLKDKICIAHFHDK